MNQTEAYRTPGQLIEGLLRERGWDQEALSLVLGVTKATISHLVTGRRRIDAELALALADIFGIEADHFLDLQKTYDLGRARLEVRPDPGRANRAALFASLPVSEMIQRGWVRPANPKDFAEIEAALVRFFGVSSVAEVTAPPHAPKRTNADAAVTPVQLAWIRRVHQIASEMVVTRYTPARAREALESLKSLLLSAAEARKVPRILSECGIRFVMVEALKSAKIDGVCLWLDGGSPVIGMSLRFDRIDNFWFVLRHELEHVLRGDGKETLVLDTNLETESADAVSAASQSERLANNAAANFCVPREYMDQFISRKAPLISKRDMLGFAKTILVHPGVVAGQLQRRTGRYDTFREYLVKIRSIVAPGAAVDGWGEVYPVRT